jgi:hypothetical protein
MKLGPDFKVPDEDLPIMFAGYRHRHRWSTSRLA